MFHFELTVFLERLKVQMSAAKAAQRPERGMVYSAVMRHLFSSIREKEVKQQEAGGSK